MSTLEVHGVSKQYGNLVALDGVSVRFVPGEIHAVLGENGAGKSTLMGVMSGFVKPNEGRVTLDGVDLPLGRAFECKRLGVEMIHQHFTLVPAFTVAENLALVRLDRLLAPSDVERRAQNSLAAAARLGWQLDPNARVGSLSVGEQQRLEILKALGGDARVLIFDEPTAVLSPTEVEELFRVLRTLRAEGRVIVLIAHKLSEVLAIADRVTVLRRGKWIATATRADVDEAQLAELMVGELPAAGKAHVTAENLRPGLTIRDLCVRGDRGEAAIRNLQLEVRRGEIYGIGGVDGNGQVELAEAIAGVRPIASGSIGWEGADHSRITPAGYIPQDRQQDGLALGMTVGDNLLIGAYRRAEFRRGPLLRLSQIKQWARGLIQRYAIRADGPGTPVSALSGGNQQKVVVSRTLDAAPGLLVAVNPTRGLDFRATTFVHDRLRQAREEGASVVLISTDLDELFALSDRTSFLSRGELSAGDGATALVGGGC